jgi:transglutaminase-like putative cysteine protease
MNSQTPHKRLANPSVYDTIGYMIKFAKEYSRNLDIRSIAEQVCRSLEPGDYASEILAINFWVDKNIRYIRDIDGAEFLKTPVATVQTGTGDCDDIATVMAALMISAGNIVRFAIVDLSSGGGGGQPNYSHVFCQVFLPDDQQWITCDPVAGKDTISMHNRVKAIKVFPFR